jgi:uncharacterized repeat protein (TIGR03803 family)
LNSSANPRAVVFKDQIMNSILGWKTACFTTLFCAATAISSPTQTFTILASFNNTNGSFSQAPLVQGFDGNLYGTTDNGGLKKSGTIFKITLAASSPRCTIFVREQIVPMARSLNQAWYLPPTETCTE